MKIAVLGSGGWGTALALLLLENGHDVTLWSYKEEESVRLRESRTNRLLSGVPLPEALKITADISCVNECEAVLLATPSFAVRTTARQAKPFPMSSPKRWARGILSWLCPGHPTPRKWGERCLPPWWQPLGIRPQLNWCRICL